MESNILYILQSNERTYCGVTNDPVRRLNQHNGILQGGAKATRGREWEYFCILVGFESRQKVLQFEWRMHHPDGKKRKSSKYHGIEGRLLSIYDVLNWWFIEKGNTNQFRMYMDKKWIEKIQMNELWKEKIQIFPFDEFIYTLG